MQYPDRFIPRYNMVSFTSIPYSEVYRRGNIQKEIISSMNLEKPNFKNIRASNELRWSGSQLQMKLKPWDLINVEFWTKGKQELHF